MRPAAPWTDIGHIQGELDEVKRQLHGKVNSYEISTLTCRVDRLEHLLWEVRTTIDGFRVELQGLQTIVEALTQAAEVNKDE